MEGELTQFNAIVPKALKDRFDRITYKHGDKSRVITCLMQKWVEEQEASDKPKPPQEKAS